MRPQWKLRSWSGLKQSSSALSGCPGCPPQENCRWLGLIAWLGAFLDCFSTHPVKRRSNPGSLHAERSAKRVVHFWSTLSSFCCGLGVASDHAPGGPVRTGTWRAVCGWPQAVCQMHPSGQVPGEQSEAANTTSDLNLRVEL